MNDLICDECGKAITDNQASVYVWNDWGGFKYLHIGACDDKSYRFSITSPPGTNLKERVSERARARA